MGSTTRPFTDRGLLNPSVLAIPPSAQLRLIDKTSSIKSGHLFGNGPGIARKLDSKRQGGVPSFLFKILRKTASGAVESWMAQQFFLPFPNRK